MSDTKTITIKPGYLVALSVRMSGGVSYRRVDLSTSRNESGALISHWETTKYVNNPEELAEAARTRSYAQATIRAKCVPTSFGLICPLGREEELSIAIEAARTRITTFNQTSQHSSMGLYVLKGLIAASDTEATQAIVSEAKSLLDAMEQGLKEANVAQVREAATQARKLSLLLEDKQVTAISEALKTARKAARQIIKRVEKAGEDAEVVVASIDTLPFEVARMAFLDLPEATVPAAIPSPTPVPILTPVPSFPNPPSTVNVEQIPNYAPPPVVVPLQAQEEDNEKDEQLLPIDIQRLADLEIPDVW